MRRAWIGMVAVLGLATGWAPRVGGVEPLELSRNSEGRLTLVVRDTEIREVFEMLSRSENVSIALGDEISGRVSVSLFEVSVDEAIRSVAQAAGYAVERRDGSYLIVEFDALGKDSAPGATLVRSFKIQYSDPEKVRAILFKHLSRFGEITALEGRRMVVVEDLPEFLERIETILWEIDREPRQILLEAKVLEIGLNNDDTLGIDWSRISQVNGAELEIGLRGLTSGTAPGLFFTILTDNLDGAIEALADEGRVRALASPQLLTLENEEAEVLVGSRLGYVVTTTINQVTTESVQFLESGVILRFTPSVDREGRILLQIHPEVSTGTVSNGIPSLTTTEVTTRLLAGDGERVFIGGLIRDSAGEGRRGVPLLHRIPLLGMLFSRSAWSYKSSETIVIVRATVQGAEERGEASRRPIDRFDRYEPVLDRHRKAVEDDLDQPWRRSADPAPAAPEE